MEKSEGTGGEVVSGEDGYIATTKTRNKWFADGRTVRLTSAQVEVLIRHACRSGENTIRGKTKA